MDPVAHTLVGAALGRSGLAKRSGLAGLALVVGANLPDVDAVTYFAGGDLGLHFRRGWTHGLPAIALWPFVLAGALVLLDRLLGRRTARFGPLLWLSLLAVATHPSLDWLNNYGMRWLMPLDGRWFHGDAVFIVDPWIWLALGGAVFLASRGGAPRLFLWALGAAAASLPVLMSEPPLLLGKILFVAGLVALGAARFAGFPRTEPGAERLNRGALAAVAMYIAGMVALSIFSRSFTLRALEREGHVVEKLMVAPAPISPFTRDVVFSTESSYRYGTLSLWPSMRLHLSEEVIGRNEASPVVRRALREREVRGFAGWARFPWGEVIEEAEAFRVILRDARYGRVLGGRGFGSAEVILPKDDLRALPPREEPRPASP